LSTKSLEKAAVDQLCPSGLASALTKKRSKRPKRRASARWLGVTFCAAPPRVRAASPAPKMASEASPSARVPSPDAAMSPKTWS
jgi:hypothetical protein